MRAHSLCVVQTYLSTQTIHRDRVSAARKHHRVVILPHTREGCERRLLRIVGKTKRRFAVEVVGVGVHDRRRQTRAGEERRRGCHGCDLFLRSNVERLLLKVRRMRWKCVLCVKIGRGWLTFFRVRKAVFVLYINKKMACLVYVYFLSLLSLKLRRASHRSSFFSDQSMRTVTLAIQHEKRLGIFFLFCLFFRRARACERVFFSTTVLSLSFLLGQRPYAPIVAEGVDFPTVAFRFPVFAT